VPARQGNKLRQVREGAGDHDFERRRRFPRFRPLAYNLRILDLQFHDRLSQKCRLFVVRINQRHPRIRQRHRERNARQPGTAPHIEYRCGRNAWRRSQGIEQMVADHPRRLPHRRQVVSAIPFLQQFEKRKQPLLRALRKRHTEFGYALRKLLRKGHAVLPVARRGAPAARAPRPAVFVLRLRWTSRTEIAAGVTPEMRAA